MDRVVFLRNLTRDVEHRCTVFTGYSALADDNHRLFRSAQCIRGRCAAIEDVVQRLWTSPNPRCLIGQIVRSTDAKHLQLAGQEPLANARVDQRRFPAGVGANQHHHVRFFEACDGRVEQPARAITTLAQRCAILATIHALDALGIHQRLEREHAFGVTLVARNRSDFVSRSGVEPVNDSLESFVPARRAQFAIFPHVGAVEALAAQAVNGVAGLVRKPLLIHVLMQARQNAQYRTTPRIDPNVRTNGIHRINRGRLAQLPRARGEGVRLGRQRTHGTNIHEVARHLGLHSLLNGGNFRVLTTVQQADVFCARHFRRKANAACALDTARHDRFDQGAHVLFFDRALVLRKPGTVATKGLCLILQVTLAALVTDRAVEWVVQKQELHHPFAGLLYLVRAGMDHQAVTTGQRTRRGWLRRTATLVFDFDQTHAAVTGNGQAVVVAESGDFSARKFSDLQNTHTVFKFDFDTVHDGFGHGYTQCW